ncbi:hypothetical protein JL722_717 [Aureococcus anophagefferens]|nr:hypothetical protein JL722_717 [Aureococcus anophagefferens]
MRRLVVAALALRAASACVLCDARRLAAPTALRAPAAPKAARPAPRGRMAPLPGCAATLAAAALAPAAAPRRRSPRTPPPSRRRRRCSPALAFFVVALVDAGRAPVDLDAEPELAEFASEGAWDEFAYVLLRGYKRAISPNLPKNCRFTPTCSEYTAIAIKELGFFKGFVLFLWRLARCSPLGGRGYDYPAWPPPAFNAGSTAVDVADARDEVS